MKLYSFPLSGHAHRARLFISLLGLPHEVVELDLKAGANKQPEYLALNPFGQVPLLDDGGTLIPDSNAILVYLAKKAAKVHGYRKTRRVQQPFNAGFPSRREISLLARQLRAW